MADTVENEVMATSNDATEVLETTDVGTAKTNALVSVLKAAGTFALLGGGMAIGMRIADKACDIVEDKVRISRAKRAAVKAEKEKIAKEKEEAENKAKSENSPDANRVLEETE